MKVGIFNNDKNKGIMKIYQDGFRIILDPQKLKKIIFEQLKYKSIHKIPPSFLFPKILLSNWFFTPFAKDDPIYVPPPVRAANIFGKNPAVYSVTNYYNFAF